MKLIDTPNNLTKRNIASDAVIGSRWQCSVLLEELQAAQKKLVSWPSSVAVSAMQTSIASKSDTVCLFDAKNRTKLCN